MAWAVIVTGLRFMCVYYNGVRIRVHCNGLKCVVIRCEYIIMGLRRAMY